MKIYFIGIISLIFTSCSSYQFLPAPQAELTANNLCIDHIDFQKSADSLVTYTISKKHFNEYSINYEFKPFLFFKKGKYNAIAEDEQGAKIIFIDKVSPGEHVFWLQNHVIFNGLYYNHAYASSGDLILEKDRKLVINQTTQQVEEINTKGDFIFVGQDSQSVYYETNFPNQVISDLTINNAHTLLEFSPEKGSALKSYKNNNLTLFNNTTLTIKLENEKINVNSIYGANEIVLPPYKESFEAINCSYYSNDTLFFCYNKSIIYKYTSNGLEKIIDTKEIDKRIKIKSFRIVHDNIYLIQEMNYKNNMIVSENNLKINNYQYLRSYDLIKVINLRNKKVTIPNIEYK